MSSPPDKTVSPPANSLVWESRFFLLSISYLGFVSLGLPDAILGVAWPSLRESFLLPHSRLGLVSMCFGAGYLLSSFYGGKLTLSLGTGTLLFVSSVLVAVAMFGNVITPSWTHFLVMGGICGLGSGGIDAGLNSYVSSHFSSRHVTWLHAFYSLGATAGPLIMTAALTYAGSWRLGYALVGSIVGVLALTFLITRRLWLSSVSPGQPMTEGTASILDALKLPIVWLQISIFFVYTGLELTIGQWTFSILTESRHFAPSSAGGLVAVYFGAIGVGRVIFGAALAERIGLDRLIRGGSLVALAAAFSFAFFPTFGVVSLAAMGLGLAPIFPCLMAATPRRMEHSQAMHAIGFQVSAAMLGAAVAPALAGLLAQRAGLETVPRFAILLAILLWIGLEALAYQFPRRAPGVEP